MRLGVAVSLELSVFLCTLFGQDCPPLTRILPSGSVSATLDSASCTLSDSSLYLPYRLDLPARGQIQINLVANADLNVILRDATGTQVDSGTSIRLSLEAGSYSLVVNG